MQVKFYLRPDGRAVYREITEVDDIDAEFFEEHEIEVSMEDCGIFYAIYAQVGPEEEDEVVYTVSLNEDESCRKAMKTLRGLCEVALRGKILTEV